MSAYFITSTGTDIGKTFVTCGLLRRLRSTGHAATAIKPVISGFDMAKAADSDCGMLLRELGEAVTVQSVDRIAPWRFSAPLSPDMAAAREGRELDFNAVVSFCHEAIATNDTLFIEGVGGVMVPLDARHTVLDWMAELGLPAVVVTGSYLGTLSHTLTALGAMERVGVRTKALIINDTGDGAVPLSDTAATLHRFLPGTDIAILPRNPSDLDFAPVAALVLK